MPFALIRDCPLLVESLEGNEWWERVMIAVLQIVSVPDLPQEHIPTKGYPDLAEKHNLCTFGTQAFVDFIFGKPFTSHTAGKYPGHIQHAHHYYAQCFEAAYTFEHEDFAECVMIAWVGSMLEEPLEPVGDKKVLADFYYAVELIFQDCQKEHGENKLKEHFEKMCDLLVCFAAKHTDRLLLTQPIKGEVSQDISRYPPAFVMASFRALKARQASELPSAMTMLREFAVKKGLKVSMTISA